MPRRLPRSRTALLRRQGVAPPAFNAYPPDSVQTIRDAAVVQSRRALELLLAFGLELPR